MDYTKVGSLILNLRKEKGMTQKDVADLLNISDKTISKWERGLGCPDVSLLRALSDILGVSVNKILSGELNPNDTMGGNMKRIKFYMCSSCGNILTSTGETEISCCGRKLEPLKVETTSEEHNPNIEVVENDYFITFDHPMLKSHFISFVAYVCYDRVLMVKMYPEQNPEVRLPRMSKGLLYVCCNNHGLFRFTI